MILERYAAAWRGARELTFERSLTVALWVTGNGGGEYHVVLPQKEPATVRTGVPADYDFGFQLDMDTLRRLDQGELNALTAMGQARSSDPTPLTFKPSPEFSRLPDPATFLRRLSFHFWTREWPEIVPFRDGATREVHGGNAAVFYYDKQFRSAWYQLKAGTHINRDTTQQANDYPQLIVVTRGRLRGRFDGQERHVGEGETVLIPPGMRSELWTEAGEYAEFVWLGFGPGA